MRKYLILLNFFQLALVTYTLSQNTPNGLTGPAGKTPVKAPVLPNASTYYKRMFTAVMPTTDSSQLNMNGSILNVSTVTEYIDGLGRPLETIAKQASPLQKDIVSPTAFDQFGNVSIQYLPYAAQTGNATDGKMKSTPIKDDSAFYNSVFTNEDIYYGKQLFDASPLNITTTQMAPGNSWAGSNVGTSFTHRANTVGDSVKIWSIAISSEDDIPTTTSNYAAGSLMVQQVTDERGIPTLTYTDELGRTVLTKRLLGTTTTNGHMGWLCTYYVYDEMSHLRMVIPPYAVQVLLTNSWSLATSNNIAANLCFSYWYDNRGRITEKHIPGKGKTYIAYDLYDRPVMAQDENLRLTKQWLFVKYDGQSRPDTSGLITASVSTPAQIIAAAAASSDYPTISGTFTILNINHYDDYAWVNGSIPTGTLTTTNINSTNFITTYNASPYYAQQITQSQRLRGLPTGSQKLVLGTSTYLYTVNIYDEKSRVIQTKQTNYTGGTDIATSQYDFIGKLLRNHLQHQKLGANTINHTLLTGYTYDPAGRLTVVTKNIDGLGTKTTLQCGYNELGQLSMKTLGGQESQSLTYNIRGWLNGINKTYVETAGSASNYFGEELFYDFGFTGTTLNGNVAGLKWKSTGDDIARAYGYSYDKDNRITGADFTQQNTGSTSWTRDKMDFSISGIGYDGNGNITSMTQRGVNVNTPLTIDSLAYTYFTSSNQLEKVKDNITTAPNLGDFQDTALSTDDYAYDVNGNIEKDLNKHIHVGGGNGIVYNFLNKPTSISVNGKGSIAYTYDASGAVLQKILTDTKLNTKTVITYIAGFVYQKILPSSGNPSTVPDTLQYALHEEGRIRALATGSFAYDFFLKDHLGNIRSVITDEQQTDAYPDASLEAATLNNEKVYYDNLDAGRVTKPSGYPNDTYTNPNNYVQDLNGNASKIGASILLKVMAGDKINVRANSWFNNGATPGTPVSPLTDIVNALVSSIPGTPGSKFLPGQAGSTIISPDVTQFLNNRDANNVSSRPKAYLNIVLLDEQLNPVLTTDGNNSYFQQVGNSGDFTTFTVTNRLMTKSGYIYIYLSNETPNIDVYFDNLQVTQTRGPLLQENGYYPFGLEMKAVSSQAAMKIQTNYKFNGGINLESSFDVDYYETYFRNYDAQIGRFTGIDALAEKSFTQTTYQYASNNPLLFNDPWGLKDDLPQQDYSAFWDNLLSTLDLYEYGGSWTATGGGGGTYNGGYNSNADAIYSNLGNAMQYWNNRGWDVGQQLNSLSSNGYIQTHYGYSKKGNWGIYVSPAYTSQTHTAADGTQWTEGSYYTGFFVKTDNGGYEAGAGMNELIGLGGLTYGIAEYGIRYNGVRLASATSNFLGNEFNAVGAVTKTANVLKGVGRGAFIIGSMISVGQGTYSLSQGNYSAASKSGLDVGMGAIGTYGGVPGFIVGGIYFGVDAFYPGGWPGAFGDMHNTMNPGNDPYIDQNNFSASQHPW